MNRKWWGWGDKDVRDEIEGHPALFAFMKSRLGLEEGSSFPCASAEQVKVPPSRLSKELREELSKAVPSGGFSEAPLARFTHSAGMGYKDLLRLRRGSIPDCVDAVAYPADEAQVVDLLRLCQARGADVIPYGGGSSVVGSLEVRRRDGRGVLSLDMSSMSKLVAMDPDSGTATFQAGISGPDLESELAARGFTLGHFPQSFE
jgi:alkyldihydroxyacetonephosphate synthase